MRLNNLLNRLRMRGIVFAIVLILIIIAAAVALLLRFGRLGGATPESALRQMNASFAKGSLTELYQAMSEEDATHLRDDLKDLSPDLIGLFMKTVRFETEGTPEVSDGVHRYNTKLHYMDPKVFSVNVLTRLEALMTEPNPSQDFLKEGRQSIEKDILQLAKETSNLVTEEGDIRIQERAEGGSFQVIGNSSSVLNVMTQAKKAAENSAGWNQYFASVLEPELTLPTVSGGLNAITQTSAATTQKPEATSDPKTSATTSRENSGNANRGQGNRAGDAGEAGNTGNAGADAGANANSNAGNAGNAGADAGANANLNAGSADQDGGNSVSGGDANEAGDADENTGNAGAGQSGNAGNNGTAGNIVLERSEVYDNSDVIPGGYWRMNIGDDLLEIAEQVYADYPEPELYVYSIIEANGLQDVDGVFYLAPGTTLYMPFVAE